MANRKRSAPILSVVLVFALLMGLTGCQSDRESKQTTTVSATTQANTTVASTTSTSLGGGEAAATTTTASGAIVFPFPAPDFAPVVFDRGQYQYQGVSPTELDDYLNRLVSDGFCLQKYEYRCYLQKNNVFIDIADNTKGKGGVSLVYYQGMSETRPGTLSSAQAQAIIGEDQLSIMEMMVPDLYEKTGAQLFYVMSRTNADNNRLRKYIVLDNQAFLMETIFQAYQVFDIDQDGQVELLAIIPGLTSGLFSFGIEVIGFDNGIVHTQYKQYAYPLGFNFLVLQADAKAAYVYAAEYAGTQLSPTTALYQLTFSKGELVFVDLRESK